jgi:hypothetical protein
MAEVIKRATFDEMMKYWGYQYKLNECDGCNNHSICWRPDGASYLQKAILSICHHMDVKEAVIRIAEIMENKPIDYYAYNKEWSKYNELLKLVGDL